MSEMFFQFSFVLVGAFAVMMLQAHAQDQSDFISIDCGLQQNKEYTHDDTKIRYIPDTDFIDTGESKAVQHELNPPQQYQFVRIFPEGKRNCYKINIKRGQKYLIRASFLYGNYDRENALKYFHLHLGSSVWDTVVITNASIPVIKEVIHIPMRNYIHICLVKNDVKDEGDVPFISTIELRPLSNDMYLIDEESSVLAERRNMATNKTEYRYPNDVNDRIWRPPLFNVMSYSELRTSSDLIQNSYQLPSSVMSTAVTPKDISTRYLYFDWTGYVRTDARYYIYLHFAEVEKLNTSLSRELTLTLDGGPRIGPIGLQYLTTTTCILDTRIAVGGPFNFTISSPRTSYAPILNAYEIYRAKEFLVPETNQEDVEAITNVKSTYKIVKNWQGDPCHPEGYEWEGVNCSYSHNNDSPRIISLNLSSSELTGEIADSIANLTMLHTLDLSNNKLTGLIPEKLSQLQELNILKFEKNELTGSVPAGIIAKRDDGLFLSLCGNPSLSGQAPCEKTKKKKKNLFVISAVVIAIVVLWVSSIAAAIVWKSKTFHDVWKYWRLKVAGTESEIEHNREGHDVFLSFRGADTRIGFARNLHDALENKKIKTFFDDQNLEKGDEIAVRLLDAIEASEISIILLSENYVTSGWCLDELVKILDCKKTMAQRVIPVFYKVDPSHIRHQSDSFSLKSWIEKGDARVPEWQNALTEVARLVGYHYTDEYEIEAINMIVRDTSDFMEQNSLRRFDTICPPDGKDELVMYMTSSARDKNFQICQSMLQSLSQFDLKHWQQRDVSTRKFRRELKKLIKKELPPPRLFVKGKYVGGYDEVSKLIKEEPWFCETLNKFSRRDVR